MPVRPMRTSLRPLAAAGVMALGVAGSIVSCSDDRAQPLGPSMPCLSCSDAGGGTSNAGSSGASGSGGTSGDVDAGVGGSPDAGSDSGADGAACGNDVQEPGEPCDGADLGTLTCVSFGFTEGELACADCAPVTTGCTGTEICSDGLDNDGDGDIDCGDGDCTAACADPCAAPTPLSNGAATSGLISGQLSPAPSSCAPATATGQVAFVYQPPLTGVVHVYLNGETSDLRLSLRSECADQGSELRCELAAPGSSAALLEQPVTEGEALYFVVESPDRTLPRQFQLAASAHTIVCGDGFIDADEECDDGNTVDEDGCSSQCEFQTDEDDPNATTGTADPYTPPQFFGSINSEDDVDVISIAVGAGQTLIAETQDLGDGACARNELDNALEVLSPSGTPLGSNDDYGTSFCAALVIGPLEAGTHYVRMTPSGVAERFQYKLVLTLQD
jgi:cysteine-rich repeat protein